MTVTPTPALTGRRSKNPVRSDRVRIEIQALRAVAVLLVVGYHLWPKRLTGGYIGVDVFFVISGFLITSHLLREVVSTGRLSLSRFWARRARRLLPASFVVLILAGVATVLLVPDTYWRQYVTEIGASSVYLQNWVLASNSVNYLAAENAASPVQHFWSLSVEEQFYIAWPLLLLGALLLVRRSSTRGRMRAVLVLLAAVTSVSFVISLVWTDALPASAYFATPTRVWEFGAGALLAFVPAGERSLTLGGDRVKAALSWAGLIAIAGGAVTLTGASAFPGFLALIPVLGAVAVIVAGDPRAVWSPTRAGGLKPVQFVGNISYSLYLWHWPLIVFVPLVLGTPLTSITKVLILLVSVVIAFASKVYVEDRFRSSRLVDGSRKRWTFLATAATALLVVVGCTIPIGVVDARTAAEAVRISDSTQGSCFGALAIDPRNDCTDPFAVAGSMTPAFAKADKNEKVDPAGGTTCETPRGDSTIRNCVLGVTSKPTRTLAMLGDSHSMHFSPALEEIAKKNHWKVITYFKSACGGTGAADVLLTVSPDDQTACAAWGAAAIADITANPAIDTIVTANLSSAYSQDNGDANISGDRYAAAWKPMLEAGKKILAIRDVPRTNGQDIPDCLALAGTDATACDALQSMSLPPDALAEAATAAHDPNVRLIDLTDHFCVDGTCHARIGGVIVYSDTGHITSTFSRSLAPYIELALIG